MSHRRQTVSAAAVLAAVRGAGCRNALPSSADSSGTHPGHPQHQTDDRSAETQLQEPETFYFQSQKMWYPAPALGRDMVTDGAWGRGAGRWAAQGSCLENPDTAPGFECRGAVVVMMRELCKRQQSRSLVFSLMVPHFVPLCHHSCCQNTPVGAESVLSSAHLREDDVCLGQTFQQGALCQGKGWWF